MASIFECMLEAEECYKKGKRPLLDSGCLMLFWNVASYSCRVCMSCAPYFGKWSYTKRFVHSCCIKITRQIVDNRNLFKISSLSLVSVCQN